MSLDALLGNVWDSDAEVELGGGLNFRNGLTAVYNPATKRIDVSSFGYQVSIDVDLGAVASGPAYTTFTVTSATSPELAGLVVGDVVYATTQLDFATGDGLCLVSAAVREPDSVALTFLKVTAGPVLLGAFTIDLGIIRRRQ
jgi:hypothetical protein